jgi:uncharacterized membrane protein YoaK (UPF0700 family)
VNDVIHGSESPRSEEEVRASLARSTEELRSALQRLERGARAKMDVGKRIAGKAPTVLIVGFLAGAILGMATARPRYARNSY